MERSLIPLPIPFTADSPRALRHICRFELSLTVCRRERSEHLSLSVPTHFGLTKTLRSLIVTGCYRPPVAIQSANAPKMSTIQGQRMPNRSLDKRHNFHITRKSKVSEPFIFRSSESMPRRQRASDHQLIMIFIYGAICLPGAYPIV